VVKVFEAAAGLFGRELSSLSKKLLETSGNFYVAWAANVAMLSWVFFTSGSFESLLSTVLFAYAAAHDIYDKNIANRIERGLMAPGMLARFVALRILLGTVFEVMSFLHMPYMQLMLTSITTGGLLWLALGTDFEDRVVSRATRIKIAVKRGCENLLSKMRSRKVASAGGGEL
jgi:hypothetical protein